MESRAVFFLVRLKRNTLYVTTNPGACQDVFFMSRRWRRVSLPTVKTPGLSRARPRHGSRDASRRAFRNQRMCPARPPAGTRCRLARSAQNFSRIPVNKNIDIGILVRLVASHGTEQEKVQRALISPRQAEAGVDSITDRVDRKIGRIIAPSFRRRVGRPPHASLRCGAQRRAARSHRSRAVRVTAFRKYCIYFRLTANETIIIRVLHGSRDVAEMAFSDEG